MRPVKKIVVIGPESTGKSTLCEQLAAAFDTIWCPEYAREYLLKYGMEYSYEDLLTIAKGQVTLEERYLKRAANVQQETPDSRLPTPDSILFIDTDQWVMKVWSEFVFGKCNQWILDQIVLRNYDLYLLCNTDLLWVRDELREYPDLENRERLFHIYKDIMINQQIPWVEISGNNEQRFSMAKNAVDQFIRQHSLD
ncbi:MAG TPA: ATP-binding protein [Puia sp.]|nr:ATP-binding protein [Puia sp.]